MRTLSLIFIILILIISCSYSIIDPTRLTPEIARTLKYIKVLNPNDEIVIYQYGRRPVSGKEVNLFQPKFYFSVPGSKFLEELTIKKLKEIFSKNSFFKNALDERFKYDSDLLQYEPGTNEYKINRLIQESHNHDYILLPK